MGVVGHAADPYLYCCDSYLQRLVQGVPPPLELPKSLPEGKVRVKEGLTNPTILVHKGFPGGSAVKNPPANAGDAESILEPTRPFSYDKSNSLCLYSGGNE